MGRMPQFFGHAGLAVGLFSVGASLLNAGVAMAGGFPPLPCQPGNAGWFTTSGISGPTIGGGICILTSPPGGNPALENFVSIDTDFLNGELPGPNSGTFEYSISTTRPGYWFSSGLIDSDVDVPNGVTVRKEIFPTAGDLSAGTNKIWDYTSTDGSNSLFQPLPNQYTTLYIKDTYTVPTGAVLDNFTNTFEQQVPGPLPILGAGAAFGFSRKLRSRIKAAHRS